MTTEDKNPKDVAASSRLDLSLFPSSAVAYGALGFTEGHLKYGGYNYRSTNVSASVYISALKRHADKFYEGEWADPMTGVPHLASMIADVAILIDGFEQGTIIDDRPPSTLDPTKFFSEMEDKVKHLQSIFPGDKPRSVAEKRTPDYLMDQSRLKEALKMAASIRESEMHKQAEQLKLYGYATPASSSIYNQDGNIGVGDPRLVAPLEPVDDQETQEPKQDS